MEYLNIAQIWEPGNENFEEVRNVINGDRSRVRQLILEPGDLKFLKTLYTSQSTKVEGDSSRYLCILPMY